MKKELIHKELDGPTPAPNLSNVECGSLYSRTTTHDWGKTTCKKCLKEKPEIIIPPITPYKEPAIPFGGSRRFLNRHGGS